MKRSILLLPIAVVVLVVILSSVFVVDERQKALVLQFGRVVSIKEDPGLAFKIPLIQNVIYYDDRILSRDIDPIEVTPSDDRRLIVDAFARYRISDVQQFRESVGDGGIALAEDRLDDILRAQMREVLGSVSSNDILSEGRAALAQRIAQAARTRAENLGLQVIDVQLKRTDLPPQNLDATFARMRAEREREAADEIARGEEAAQRIRALADRTVIELTSEATREAEIARGEADAQRSAIFASAFNADPEFFEFYRSLSAYTQALQGSNSTLVLSPDSEFFNYLRDPNGQAATSAAAALAVPPAAVPPAADPVGNAAEGAAPDPTPESVTDDAPPAETPEADAGEAAEGAAPVAAQADLTASPPGN